MRLKTKFVIYIIEENQLKWTGHTKEICEESIIIGKESEATSLRKKNRKHGKMKYKMHLKKKSTKTGRPRRNSIDGSR